MLVLQDSLLQQLLKQTALLTQLVCAPAAERPASQAVAKEQAPEQAVVPADEPVPSQTLSASERREQRQGESLQKLEAEAASQKKATPKTPQPAFPRRQDSQDSFHVPSRQDPTPKRLFPSPNSGESLHQAGHLADLKAELRTPSPISANLRIDWMFGRSSEKTAKRDLERDQAADRAREAAAARLKQQEDTALETAASLGYSPKQVTAALAGQRNKGGRPKGSRNTQRLTRAVNGLRKRRADVSAAGKLQLFEEADRLLANSGSKRDAQRRLQAEYGISESFAVNLMKPAKRAKVEQFLQTTPQGKDGLRPQGSHLGFCHLGSKSLGKRLPGPGKSLGKTDHLKPVWRQTARWSQYEEANQQTLAPADLLDDFLDRLEARLAVREAEEKAGSLTPQAEAELKALRKKQHSMQTNKKAREKYKASLVVKCQLRSRSCQQVKNLSPGRRKGQTGGSLEHLGPDTPGGGRPLRQSGFASP